MSNRMFPQFSTLLFSDIWEEASDFKTDFQASPFAGAIHYGEAIPGSSPTAYYPDDVSLVFYLLYAKYGNSPIANWDINQFKFKVYSVIFQYGPTWEKKLDIQKKLRELTDEEVRLGSKAIYNHAFNPSDAPSTGTLEEVDYINDQNTANYKKSPIEAYSILWEALNTDITEAFMKRFRPLFKAFVAPEFPIIYENDAEEEDDD